VTGEARAISERRVAVPKGQGDRASNLVVSAAPLLCASSNLVSCSNERSLSCEAVLRSRTFWNAAEKNRSGPIVALVQLCW
jgi:hypothetical protein